MSQRESTMSTASLLTGIVIAILAAALAASLGLGGDGLLAASAAEPGAVRAPACLFTIF